ncbi:hypothetical protein QOZ80_4BG0341790 [Eleusine coracana subsp. coracana]|nr:hypothetical protein QOZ80_4BG0341790 [Eleusine coracana subsp. coracana]
MRAARPGLLDGVLIRLDAILCRAARLAREGARADLVADGRRIRAAARRNAAIAPAYDRAEAAARAVRRWAEAAWRDNRAAARAACLFLRLAAAVACAAAAALADAAYESARTIAPPVLSHLRTVIVKETRMNQSGEGAAVFFVKYRDLARLVKASLFLGLSADVLVYAKAVVGLSVPFLLLPCFAALCVTAVLASGGTWPFSLPHDNDDDSNGTPADLEAEPWKLLWLVAVTAYLIDVCLLRFTIGARPLPVAFLALCHVKVIHVGKKEVQREEGSAEGGAEWRRAATGVLAASVVKVAAVGAVLGVQMAALSLVSLCGMSVFLVLSDDSDGGEDGAGSAGSVIIGGADEVRSEGSNTGAEDEQGSALELEEHCHTSSEGHVEEQRDEEQESSSMDGWDFVEADPTAGDQS